MSGWSSLTRRTSAPPAPGSSTRQSWRKSFSQASASANPILRRSSNPAPRTAYKGATSTSSSFLSSPTSSIPTPSPSSIPSPGPSTPRIPTRPTSSVSTLAPVAENISVIPVLPLPPLEPLPVGRALPCPGRHWEIENLANEADPPPRYAVEYKPPVPFQEPLPQFDLTFPLRSLPDGGELPSITFVSEDTLTTVANECIGLLENAAQPGKLEKYGRGTYAISLQGWIYTRFGYREIPSWVHLYIPRWLNHHQLLGYLTHRYKIVQFLASSDPYCLEANRRQARAFFVLVGAIARGNGTPALKAWLAMVWKQFGHLLWSQIIQDRGLNLAAHGFSITAVPTYSLAYDVLFLKGPLPGSPMTFTPPPKVNPNALSLQLNWLDLNPVHPPVFPPFASLSTAITLEPFPVFQDEKQNPPNTLAGWLHRTEEWPVRRELYTQLIERWVRSSFGTDMEPPVWLTQYMVRCFGNDLFLSHLFERYYRHLTAGMGPVYLSHLHTNEHRADAMHILFTELARDHQPTEDWDGLFGWLRPLFIQYGEALWPHIVYDRRRTLVIRGINLAQLTCPLEFEVLFRNPAARDGDTIQGLPAPWFFATYEPKAVPLETIDYAGRRGDHCVTVMSTYSENLDVGVRKYCLAEKRGATLAEAQRAAGKRVLQLLDEGAELAAELLHATKLKGGSVESYRQPATATDSAFWVARVSVEDALEVNAVRGSRADAAFRVATISVEDTGVVMVARASRDEAERAGMKLAAIALGFDFDAWVRTRQIRRAKRERDGHMSNCPRGDGECACSHLRPDMGV